MFRSKRRVPLYTHQIEQDYSNRILRIKTQLELYNDLKQIAEDLPNSPQIIQLKAITQKKIIEDIGILQQTGFDITSLIATFGVKLLKADIIEAENTITEKQAMATSDAGVVVDLVPEDRILADRAPMVIPRDARRARVQRVIARRASRARSQEREADPHPIDMPEPIVEEPAAVVEEPAAVVEEPAAVVEEEKKASSEELDDLEKIRGGDSYQLAIRTLDIYKTSKEGPEFSRQNELTTKTNKVTKQKGIKNINKYVRDCVESDDEINMIAIAYLVLHNPQIAKDIREKGPVAARGRTPSKPQHALFIAYHLVYAELANMKIDLSDVSYKDFTKSLDIDAYFKNKLQNVAIPQSTTAASVTTKKQKSGKKK